jgi:hypothetical protein
VELAAAMATAADRVILEVSAHHGSREYQDRFKKVRVVVDQWRQQYSINIVIREAFKTWTRRYHVRGREVVFPDGSPRAAWEACIGKRCKQLFLGKIWKCPPITYFDLMQRNMRVADRWRELAASYRALDAGCDDEALAAFFGLEEEDVCRLCPSALERFELPNPLLAHQRG